MPKASILVVDDETNILTSISRALKLEGYAAEVAGNAQIALQKIKQTTFDVILADVQMPGMSGLELLERLRELEIDTPVLVMSGNATVSTAISATRLGAHDFLEKPIGTDRLLLSLENCLQTARLREENVELKRRAGATQQLLGESDVIKRLRERIELAGSAQAPVLITGERGTGKELVAQAIHRGSARTARAFEKLNCAAVPENLIESELFGHEAGAFTGAAKQRLGKFERADGGTLFLDEVGDMPHPMQAKLLRALQEGEFERVGGAETIRVDIRTVAATNRDLPEEIDAERFRADLYDRLNVLPIRVAPLRERPGDIPLLAERFLQLACETNDRALKRFQKGAIEAIKAHSFPGNVRELKNLVERLVILSVGDEITAADVREHLPSGASAGSKSYFVPEASLREMMEEAERDLISHALAFHDGHVTKTAAGLKLERSHLYKKMKALGLRSSRADAEDDE